MTEETALLEIKDLCTDIRLPSATLHALDHINLSVKPGEALGLVGESGSGKTMTAMSIEKLLPAGGQIVGGQILFQGQDLVTVDENTMRSVRGNQIGMIFQDPLSCLNPVKTIGSQVAEPLLIHKKISAADAKQQVIDMFAKVGLPSPAKRYHDYPHQLSGGQRQRVMIAMALICQPKLLIADEPTTALDVTIQKQILDLIDQLRAELGMSLILVTHDLGVIAGHVDKVAVMYGGSIVESASTDDLFHIPRHRYTEALFKSLPERAVSTAQPLHSIPGIPPDLTLEHVGCRFAARCSYATTTCTTNVPAFRKLDDSSTHVSCFHINNDVLDTVIIDNNTDIDYSHSIEAEYSRKSTSPALTIPADAPSDTAPRLTETPPHSTPLLSVQHIVKNYAVKGPSLLGIKKNFISAAANISFTIHEGHSVGLVGESGSGKTTLGKLIVGLEQPDTGDITFRQQSLLSLKPSSRRKIRRNIQLMFQDSTASLDPKMKIRQILREPLDIAHTSPRKQRDLSVDEALSAVGLPVTAADRYPHEFSGGQRQRIGLARALALQPDLIVADEPVSALDISIQAQILNLIKKLQRERNLTFLFISHDLSVVRYVCDQVAVMYLGKIVEMGPVDQVYDHPLHHYTRGLIDTIPSTDPATERTKSTHTLTGELPSASNPPTGCRFHTRCPKAQKKCSTIEPVLTTISDNHQVACHFPVSNTSPLS